MYAQSIAIGILLKGSAFAKTLLLFLLLSSFSGLTVLAVFFIGLALLSRTAERTTGAMLAFFLEFTAALFLYFLFLTHNKTVSGIRFSYSGVDHFHNHSRRHQPAASHLT